MLRGHARHRFADGRAYLPRGKSRPLASFDEMVKGLDKQKQVREQIFAQELSSMKDRDRILEEKFQEAMKRAEKDKDKPYRNPLDMD